MLKKTAPTGGANIQAGALILIKTIGQKTPKKQLMGKQLMGK